MEQFVPTVFGECFDRDIINGEAVIDLVELFAGLEEEDLGFHSDFILYYEKEEYVAAYHIGLPHFERTLLKMLNEQGESIIALKKDGTITSVLATLLKKFG